MEATVQNYYRKIAFSLIEKSKTSKGKALIAQWRDNKHFEDWLNNVDIENNKKIKLTASLRNTLTSLEEVLEEMIWKNGQKKRGNT